MDKSIYNQAYNLSKRNPSQSVFVLFDGEYRVEFVNSDGMGVEGFVDVAEFLNGKMLWSVSGY
jgi:major membrane immunogen (membrane-anchored lipoprotein)